MPEKTKSISQSIERIAECCGFGSAAVLRLHLQRLLHTSPQSYRHAFHREKVTESPVGVSLVL